MNNTDWRTIIDRLYQPGRARSILLTHSRAVAELALALNERTGHTLEPADIEASAMLHDIGIIETSAPGIGCHGTEPYIRHGIIGAEILRRRGLPEWVARIAERHTGAGLTREDIAGQNLPLPTDRILVPETTLERLICYADKFFSKTPGRLNERKSIERVRSSMAAFGSGSLSRFDALADEFGPVD